MDFQHAHLHQPDEARQILDVGINLRLLLAVDIEPLDRLGRFVTDMFLIKRLHAGRRRAHQCQKATGELGQDPIPDLGVIARDIELGEIGAGIKDAIGVGQPHAFECQAPIAGARRLLGFPRSGRVGACRSFLRAGGGLGSGSRFRVINDVSRILVLAQSLK